MGTERRLDYRACPPRPRAVVEHDGHSREISKALARDRPLRLRAWPCLLEPGNLDNLVLKLDGRPIAARQAREYPKWRTTIAAMAGAT